MFYEHVLHKIKSYKEFFDWPIDDVDEAYPVFETKDFSANERMEAYNKIRNFLKEKELL